jgi:FkbM family methyltransferase
MQYFGVNDMDKKIIEKYLNYENGFYLEIGGNDGITQSNTANLEFFRNWSGMLVEPIFYKYNLMKNFRKKSICLNACVSDKDGEIVKFNDVNLMSFVENARKSEEADEFWMSEGEKCQNMIRSSYNLETIMLQTLLDKHNITDIDFFSLDVEGYELQVLQGLNFNIVRPKYILIECTHKDEIFSFMDENKYEMIEFYNNNDYLFKDVR